ncbi:MAG: flagellar basal body P-ring formation chaperone FlgA [Acetobacteraceae bacterium]
MAGLVVAVATMTPALAATDIWVTTHQLLPGDIVQAEDLEARTPARHQPHLITTDRDLVGMEVRRRINGGQPVTFRDVGPRTAVKANAMVEVRWQAGPLSLVLRGRALEAGAVGDEIRVMNATTSRTLRGTIIAPGVVEVEAAP